MKTNIIRSVVAMLALLSSEFYAGCMTSTAPPTTATVTTYSIMDGSTVSSSSSAKAKIESILQEGAVCDSVTVASAAFLISDLKMHHDESDSAGFGTIKDGAYVAHFSSQGSQLVATVSVPPASYDRVKFEMHRYDPILDVSLAGDSIAINFMTPAHNTVILEGMVYLHGVGYPFKYESSVTANEQEFFANGFTVEAGKGYIVEIHYSPSTALRVSDGLVLDPSDPSNEVLINAGIKAAFRASVRISS